jgi:PAS domain S-box-containing protein
MIPEGLQAYVEQQQQLLNLTRQIASSAGLNEIVPHILDGIARAIRPDVARLLLTGVGGYWHVFDTGPQGDELTPMDKAVLELVNRRGEVELSRDAQGDDLSFMPPELDTLIAVPLMAHEAQCGILWMGFRSSHLLGEAEWTYLYILAGQAAIAIANARSFEAARRGREWLAAILASTPDPVLVVDRELRLQLANPAAQEMSSSLTRDAIGSPLDQMEQPAGLVDLLREYNHPDAQKVMEFAAESGQVYSPSISEVRTENGEMTGWVLVLRDITHFKRLHDSMSDFLSTVSHDMRSPLTYMKGFLDMLGMVGELNDKQREFVGKIAGGVTQMSDLVEKVLEAGKLDPMTGTYKLSRETCDVVEVVQKMMTNLAGPAATKKLEMSCTIAEGIPILNVDKAMVTSAFTNLAENAIKYTPEGGHVWVDLGTNDDELVFQVRDNGYGISPENQARLFARNVRVHRREWKQVKGSGLGLFIVKNVAQRHGGDAWVESIEGKGSTFYMTIPLNGVNLLGGGDLGACD